MFLPLPLSQLRPARLLALWAASLGLALTGCSVLPDAPAPASPKASATANSGLPAAGTNVLLPPVIVIAPSVPVLPTGPITIPGGGDEGGGGGTPDTPSDPGGGGGPGGGTPGDGSGPSPSSGLMTAETGTPSIGDTQAIMSKKWDAATTIKVVFEFTRATHVVDKITVVSTGLTAATKFGQVGNGVASYNTYSNTYSYSATFQQVLTTVATGDILGGPLFEVYGTYYAGSNQYTIDFKQIP